MRTSLQITGLVILLLGCGGTETKQIEDAETKTGMTADTVAATVGSESVLLSEVDRVSAGAQKRAKMAYDQQINQIRRDALESIIEGKLVDLEVSARKLENRQALIKLEVVDKTKGPTAKQARNRPSQPPGPLMSRSSSRYFQPVLFPYRHSQTKESLVLQYVVIYSFLYSSSSLIVRCFDLMNLHRPSQ